MANRASTIALALFVTAISYAQDSHPENRRVQPIVARKQVALVIGNAAYGNRPLANSVNDARAIARLLQQLNYDVALVTDADRKAMGQAIDKFVAKLGTGDVAFFYFSGHGMQVDGENYLIPIDFEIKGESDVRYDAHPAGRIQDLMERSGAKLNIMVLDACRDNPFHSGNRASGGGLAAMTGGKGTFIAFATSPGKTASDNPGGRNGLFTQYLLQTLPEPGLGLSEVFDVVRERVDAASNGRQLPWTLSSVVGRYSFVSGNPTLGGNPTPSVSSISVSAPPPPPSKLPGNGPRTVTVKDVSERVLRNGLRVLLHPDAAAPKLTVDMTYLAGTSEVAEEAGMAHVMEHLGFGETRSGRSIKNEVDGHAADGTWSTSYDATSLVETMTATEANLTWALQMEADRMTNLRVSDEILRREMPAIQNEFERSENFGANALWERMSRTAFAGHRYGTPIIGRLDQVQSTSAAKVDAFYRKYYQPDNAILIITGRFDLTNALAVVSRTFGGVPRPQRTLQRPVKPARMIGNVQPVELRRAGVQAPLFALMYPAPAANDPDSAAMDVLGALMNNGPATGGPGAAVTGRLSKALVETKSAVQTFFSVTNLLEGGFIQVGVTLNQAQALPAARRAAIEAVEDFADTPPTEEEVQSAKARLVAALDRRIQDPIVLAISLAQSSSEGDWHLLFTARERLAEVTSRDVVRVAQKYLKEANRTEGSLQ